MSFNPNYLDLIHTVWSPEEFEKHNLTLIKGETLKIAIAPEAKKEGPTVKKWNWGVGVIQGFKHWSLGHDDPSNIFAVSEGINHMAHQLLNDEYDQSMKALRTPQSLEERIAVIQGSFQHLVNLKQNLTSHDKVVQKFNQRFIFKEAVIGCPTHKKTIAEVDEKLGQLAVYKKFLEMKIGRQKKVNFVEFERLISELKINLDNGLTMTKEVLLRAYPLILKQAHDLGLEADTHVLSPLHTLLNKKYVSYLIQAIKQDQIPLPLSIKMFFSKLGINEGDMQEKINAGRGKLIANLESYLEEGKLLQPSPEFVRNIQKDFLEIAAEHLAPSQEQAALLKPIIEKVYLFELENQQLMQQAEQQTRKEYEDIFLGLDVHTEELVRQKQILDDKWRLYQFPDFMPDIMQQLMSKLDLDLKHLASSEAATHISAVFKEMQIQWNDRKFHSLYSKNADEVILKFAEEAQQLAHIPTWFEKNAHAQRFAFNQASWGEQHIFGEGVCAAINYRWIRHLIQNPSATIHSMEDLDESIKTRKETAWIEKNPLFLKAGGRFLSEEESGVTAHDRIVQATYQIERSLGRTNAQGSVGDTILKRDRMTYHLVEEGQSSIDSLIDALYQDHFYDLTSDMTRGLVDVGIYEFDAAKKKFSHGHALGMQIEPTRHLYRFWDVNSGFYQYSSLEEMREAFKEYMKEFYSGTYNYFQAGLYQEMLVA